MVEAVLEGLRQEDVRELVVIEVRFREMSKVRMRSRGRAAENVMKKVAIAPTEDVRLA